MFLRRGFLRLIGHFLAVVLMLASGTALAASETLVRKAAVDEVTAELVQTRLKQLDGSQELEETLKTRLRDLYQQALHELESAKTWSGKAARFEQMAASAPRELATAKATLAALPAHPLVVIPPDMTLPQFDQGISKKEAELSQGRAALAELEAEPKRRASQRVDIPKAIAAAKDRVADSDKQLQAAAPADELSQVTAVRRLLLLAQKQAVLAEIAAYGKEITAYEAMAELTSVRRDLAARQVALAEQEIKQWQEVLNRRREQEADKQVQRARLEATQAHPAIRKLAQDNAQLAEMRKELAREIADSVRQLEQTQQRLTILKEQFKRIQEKVDAVGPSNAIGLLLRKQREALPNIGVYRRNIKGRQTAIREGQLALLQLEDRRSALANLEIQVRSALENLDQPNGVATDPALESAVRELLKTEKEYLDALIGDHNSSFDKLVDLDNLEQQLIQETEACARYIDERVLWISSTPAIAFSDLRNAGDAVCWLARPEGWREVGRALASDMVGNPVPWVFALLVMVPLVRCRGRLRNKLLGIGEQTARANCYHFVPTLEALVLSVALTAMIPMTLWFVDWRLSAEIDTSEWCKAVGSGLAAVAKIYFIFGMLGQICHPQGLGGAHFAWNPAGLRLLRGQIRWFLLVALPLVFLSGMLKIQENERWRDSLGRLCFMAGGALFSLFLQRALRPGGSVFEAMLANRRGGWLDRLRYVWYPLIVLYPVVLAVAAGAGYYYTSQQLARRVFGTIYLLVGILVLRALLLRWTLVNRRKLAIEQARLRRAAAQADTIAGVEAASPSALPACADPNRDLATINSQTRRPHRILAGAGRNPGGLARVGRRVAGAADPQPRTALANRRDRDGNRPRTRRRRRIANRRSARRRYAGRPRNGDLRARHDADRRKEHPRPAGNGPLAAHAAGCGHSLCRGRGLPLRHHPGGHPAGLQHHRLRLVAGPMVAGRHQRRPRLRTPGNLRQLRLRPHHPLRTAHSRRRRHHRRHHHGNRLANPHAGDHRHQLGPQGTHYSQ